MCFPLSGIETFFFHNNTFLTQVSQFFLRTMHFDNHWLATLDSGSQGRHFFTCDLREGVSQGVGGAPSAMSLQDATVESNCWPALSTRARALILAMYSNWNDGNQFFSGKWFRSKFIFKTWVPERALSIIDWGIQPWKKKREVRIFSEEPEGQNIHKNRDRKVTLMSVSRSHWKRHRSGWPSTGRIAQHPGPFSPRTFFDWKKKDFWQTW